MKMPKTDFSKNENSSNLIFEYIDDFPIHLNSMKGIEEHQLEIENELENIFKGAFKQGMASRPFRSNKDLHTRYFMNFIAKLINGNNASFIYY